jgi:hypothetical protein
MMTCRSCLVTYPLSILLVASCVLPVNSQYAPQPLPEKDGFPSPDDMAAEQNNPAALRAHGWTLFQLVWKNVAPRGFKPLWYTWCTDAEMFDPPTPVNCAGNLARALDQDSRMQGLQVRSGNTSGDPSLPLLPNVISGVYISPALANYIQRLPVSFDPPIHVRSGGTYTDIAPVLYSALLKNNVGTLPVGSSDEVAVKVAWVEVPCPSSSNSPPPSLPAWDGTLPAGPDAHLDPSTFPKVYIDPQSLTRKGCQPSPNVKVPKGAQAFKRDDFFWFQKISNDQLTSVPSLNPQPGSYLMLVGMHIITHEQKDWVWATYWLSTPKDTEHLGGKPTVLRSGKGAHFAMNISLNEEEPIYNPFLEGKQEGFEKANCMRCHRAASVFRSPDKGTLICSVPANDARPDAGPKPPLVETSFLWTLARRATNFCDGSN